MALPVTLAGLALSGVSSQECFLMCFLCPRARNSWARSLYSKPFLPFAQAFGSTLFKEIRAGKTAVTIQGPAVGRRPTAPHPQPRTSFSNLSRSGFHFRRELELLFMTWGVLSPAPAFFSLLGTIVSPPKKHSFKNYSMAVTV